MFPAEARAPIRRTYVVVMVFEVLVIAALWLVGRIYG